MGAKLGVGGSAVALAYVLAQEFPSFAIIGSRTVAQLAAAMVSSGGFSVGRGRAVAEDRGEELGWLGRRVLEGSLVSLRRDEVRGR